MYNFFVNPNDVENNTAKISGKDFNHVKNVLRMKKGEEFLISVDGASYLCVLKEFFDDYLTATILERDGFDTSLGIEIYLFQGLPKSDKFEFIVQKAVELGASQIIPVQMERCIAKIENNKVDGKISRYNAISESAAKQCKRNFIPQVKKPLSLKDALEVAKTLNHFFIPYENELGITSTKNALSSIKKGDKVGILIGPEGGFSQSEIDLAKTVGTSISLGKRILRTETAAVTALSMLMLYAEMKFE